MRVIAGKRRGAKLLGPEEYEGTRPISDRAKQALFNIIQVRLPNARFLDLFAGTGGVGIEALSQGAAHATFVMSLSRDGSGRVAVVRQAHHWGGGNRAEPAAFVLSVSKDGRSRIAVVRQAHHGVGSPSPCTTRSP